MADFYNPSTGYPNNRSGGGGGAPPGGSGGSSFYSQGGYGQTGGHGSDSGGYSAGDSSAYGAYGAYGNQAPSSAKPTSTNAAGTSSGGGATSASGGAPGQPNLFNPVLAATMFNAATSGGVSDGRMVDAAAELGGFAITSGWARLVPFLEPAMISLRKYFAVDNGYVLRKVQRLMLPFLFKDWRRMEMEMGAPDKPIEYAPPLSDDNAFDLYLPAMSMITYVLLCALCYGTAGKFDPEVLPDVTTKCFVTQLLEVLAMRFGFYAMQAPVHFLDLFAVTGYKYLGLCINMLFALALSFVVGGWGQRVYYLTFVWTASAISFFVLKTMANNIPTITASTGPKREFMVLGFAASQFATMWFVSQTKFLS